VNLPWGMLMSSLMPLIYLFMRKEKGDTMETSLESIRFTRTGASIREQATKREAAILAEVAADEAKLAEQRKIREDAAKATNPVEGAPGIPATAIPSFAAAFLSVGKRDHDHEENLVVASIKRQRDAASALNTLARNIDVQEKYQLTFVELVFIGY